MRVIVGESSHPFRKNSHLRLQIQQQSQAQVCGVAFPRKHGTLPRQPPSLLQSWPLDFLVINAWASVPARGWGVRGGGGEEVGVCCLALGGDGRLEVSGASGIAEAVGACV